MPNEWEIIEAALVNLPGRKASYRVHASTLAEILMVGCDPRTQNFFCSKPPFSGMPQLSYPAWRKSASLNNAEKQIKAIVGSKNLEKVFEGLSQTAVYALVESGADFTKFDRFKTSAPGAVDGALARIREWGIKHPVLKSYRSGQPTKIIASHIAKLLAYEYFAATGKRPSVSTISKEGRFSPSGAYFKLVATVFKALKIDASPEAVSRKAATLWRHNEKSLLKSSKLEIRGIRELPEPLRSQLLEQRKNFKNHVVKISRGRPNTSAD